MNKILFFLGFFNLMLAPHIVKGQIVHKPGEILVQFSKDTDPGEWAKANAMLSGEWTGLRVEQVISAHINVFKLQFNPQYSDDRALLEHIRRDKQIAMAQFNHIMQYRADTIPNDPEFENQWHHLNTGQNDGTEGADIGSTMAWATTTGGVTATGDTIVVCVIEGGNANHEDLIDNRWVNRHEIPGNGIDDDGNGFVDDYFGWNVATDTDQGVFTGGHGTQVMGMIGAKGNNDLGVAGVNWDVKIMSVAGTGQSSIEEADVLAAYNYALVMRKQYDETDGALGAFVVATNASWGLNGGDINDFPLWSAFYDTLGTYGILNCGATTNNNVNIDLVGDVPTAAPSDYMISVTASNRNDVRSTGYGAVNVDLASPGMGVRTTSGSANYTTASGTSFASPLTAGAIALLYSVPCNSFMDIVKNNPQLGADYVRFALLEGVDVVEGLIGFTATGGRLNVYNSLNILLDNCTATPCLPPFAFNYEISNDTTYTFTWNSANDEGVAIRYKLESDSLWTVVDDISNDFFIFNAPELCANYTFEIAAICLATPEGELSFGSTINFESKGCCIAPSGLDIHILGDDVVDIFWVMDFNIESYLVHYRESDGDEWLLSGSYTEPMATIMDLDPCTFYDVRITPSCAAGFDTSSVASFRTLGCGPCIDNEYCIAGGESTFLGFIEAVAIDNLTNSSGNNSGYAFFENLSVELEQSQTYELTVTPGFNFGTFGQLYIIWIDFNQDGVFEDDGAILLSGQSVTGEFIGSFTIPESASLGSTRMRVAMRNSAFGASIPMDCGTYGFGEVEDYCVEIVPSTLSISSTVDPIPFLVFPNPGDGMFRFEAKAFQQIESSAPSIQVHDLSGKLVAQHLLQKASGTLDLQHLENGVYLYSVLTHDASKLFGSGKLVIMK